jgi:hypothetical protein
MTCTREPGRRRNARIDPGYPRPTPVQEVEIARRLCELTEEMNMLLWDRYFHLFRELDTQSTQEERT